MPVSSSTLDILGGNFIRGMQLASDFPTAPSLGEGEEETTPTTPPSWPGCYMGGGARWPSIKGSAVIPGRKNHPLLAR
jgi:hypothetical protein